MRKFLKVGMSEDLYNSLQSSKREFARRFLELIQAVFRSPEHLLYFSTAGTSFADRAVSRFNCNLTHPAITLCSAVSA